MIVIDASVVLEALLGSRLSEPARDIVFDPDAILHAPHLVDLEVVQVVRRYVLKGSITARRAEEVISDFIDLPIERYSHELLLRRVWELHANLTTPRTLLLRNSLRSRS